MILSIAAKYRNTANEACRALWGAGAADTFTVPLYDPTTGEIRRYWCSWYGLSETEYARLDAACPNVVRHEGAPAVVLATLALTDHNPKAAPLMAPEK